MMMCLTIAGISTSCSGRNAVAKTDSELRSLVRDFNRKDGFNVVYVNGLLTAIARSAAGVAMFSEDMDPEARTALKACRDVKGLIRGGLVCRRFRLPRGPEQIPQAGTAPSRMYGRRRQCEDLGIRNQ